MKQLLVLLLLIPLFSLGQFKVPDKIPNTYVFDYANVLSDSEEAELNRKITRLRDSSSVEMAVVVLQNLQGQPIENAALDIFNEWGIGKAHLDNGLLYVISIEDRKFRLETGYGMEDEFPSFVCQQIIDRAIPNYKIGDYYGGISTVVTDLLNRLDPTIKAQLEEWHRLQAKKARENWQAVVNALPLVACICIGIALIIYLFVRDKKRRRLKAEELTRQKEYNLECKRLKASLERLRSNTNIESKKRVIQLLIEKCERRGLKVDTSEFTKYIKALPIFLNEEMKIGTTKAALDHCRSIHNAATNALNSLEAFENGLKSEVLKIDRHKRIVEELREDLPRLKQAATHELHNTTFKEKDLMIPQYMRVMAFTGALHLIYNEARELKDRYDNIIHFKQRERERIDREEQEKLAAIRREKQRKKDEEEEEERRKRRRASDSSSSWSSGSSWGSGYSGGSSGGSSMGSFGGGRSGGGGASGGW